MFTGRVEPPCSPVVLSEGSLLDRWRPESTEPYGEACGCNKGQYLDDFWHVVKPRAAALWRVCLLLKGAELCDPDESQTQRFSDRFGQQQLLQVWTCFSLPLLYFIIIQSFYNIRIQDESKVTEQPFFLRNKRSKWNTWTPQQEMGEKASLLGYSMSRTWLPYWIKGKCFQRWASPHPLLSRLFRVYM